MTATAPAPSRHLRPRGDGIEQPVTTVELFFDLVYVFAVTQTSHMILADLTVAEVRRAAFLLLIVWWAWIYTTWMANWFDPASPAVRAVLIVAGIIAVAVGDDVLIADPGTTLHGVGLAMVLGGPALYLVAESLFRFRLTGAANVQRLAVAAILVLLAPVGAQISALALSATVATLLTALALWELRYSAPGGLMNVVPHLG